MAKKPTAPAALVITDFDRELLKAAITATNANSYVSVTPEASNNLVAAGLVETNPAIVDASGIATRATEKGLKFMVDNSTAPEVAAPVAASAIAIDTGIALPTIKRANAGNSSKFPFDALPVGGSFHIALVEGKNVAKTLAAAVSNANARYAASTGEKETVTMPNYKVDASGKRIRENGHFIREGDKQVTRDKLVKTRDFVVRSVGAADTRGAGMRVFRIA